MLSLRALRISGPYTSFVIRRGNASLPNAVREPVPDVPSPLKIIAEPVARRTKTPAPEPHIHVTQGRRHRRQHIPPQRPPISNENPRKWNRPIAEGAIPAYDLALKLIKADSICLRKEADGVKAIIETLEQKVAELGGWGSEGAREVEGELEIRREKLRILQIQSQINLPEVRWKVNNAMVDMSNPAHRHLFEQRWRSGGDLDLLMERIHQMHVIPDVLPDLRPTIDIRVAIGAPTTPKLTIFTKKRYFEVEPGVFLRPEQTIKPPSLYANVFHTDTRLYTLLLIDPDVPHEETHSFRTFLHWLRPNIPLSASHRTRIEGLDDHTAYVPPHPQQGTPYHRYILLLLLQPPLDGTTYSLNTETCAKAGVATSMHLDIPVIRSADRKHFNVREFMARWGLDGAQGGGAHMWRALWTRKVSVIYEGTLNEFEPRYGRQPKKFPYTALKLSQRYYI